MQVLFVFMPQVLLAAMLVVFDLMPQELLAVVLVVFDLMPLALLGVVQEAFAQARAERVGIGDALSVSSASSAKEISDA